MTKWTTALGSHLTLIVFGTAATLAVACHSWPIGAAGVLACGALVANDKLAGLARRSRRALPPTSLDPSEHFKDPQSRAAVAALHAAREELEETLRETPGTLLADLSPALVQITDLETRGAKLARRSEEIASFLAKSDQSALRREIDALAERGRKTTDTAARAHYAAAFAARTDHLKTLVELAWTKERIGATLLSIAAALDALAPKIVRLRGLDGGAADVTRDVGRDLATMNAELAAFEDVLVEVSEAGQAGDASHGFTTGGSA